MRSASKLFCHIAAVTVPERGRGRVHTNGLENFWSLLKRGIKGTYVSIEPFHLSRYLDEQMFPYNNRLDMNDGDRFHLVVRQIVGKRLTYAELAGKIQEGEMPANWKTRQKKARKEV